MLTMMMFPLLKFLITVKIIFLGLNCSEKKKQTLMFFIIVIKGNRLLGNGIGELKSS